LSLQAANISNPKIKGTTFAIISPSKAQILDTHAGGNCCPRGWLSRQNQMEHRKLMGSPRILLRSSGGLKFYSEMVSPVSMAYRRICDGRGDDQGKRSARGKNRRFGRSEPAQYSPRNYDPAEQLR
jgi:hypothetical protein